MDSHSAPPEDSRLERCGFCKLYGPELEFYSRRYDIQIGRRSKSTKLDVVLGRCHLRLGLWLATIALLALVR